MAGDFSVADLQGRLGPHVLQGKIFFLIGFIFIILFFDLFLFVCFVFVWFFWGGGGGGGLVLLSVDQTVGEVFSRSKN